MKTIDEMLSYLNKGGWNVSIGREIEIKETNILNDKAVQFTDEGICVVKATCFAGTRGRAIMSDHSMYSAVSRVYDYISNKWGMMYKWNEKHIKAFWDPHKKEEYEGPTDSDKELLARYIKDNPVNKTLLNLIDIVEKGNPTEDEWGRPTESLPL